MRYLPFKYTYTQMLFAFSRGNVSVRVTQLKVEATRTCRLWGGRWSHYASHTKQIL